MAFAGGMFWLTDWDIWTETIERAGRLLRCRLLGEHQGQTDAFGSQAELYSADEGIEIQGAVTLALIFEWDAYVIPAVGDVLGFISHDGYVEFAARTEGALAPTKQRLGPYQQMLATAGRGAVFVEERLSGCSHVQYAHLVVNASARCAPSSCGKVPARPSVSSEAARARLNRVPGSTLE